MLSLLVATVALGLTHSSPKPETGVILSFFVLGEGKRAAEQSKLMEMQKAHIDNLGDNWRKGNMIAAGPLQDPEKRRRGITVITKPRGTDILPFFKNDPYVQNHIMEVEHAWWEVSPDHFLKVDSGKMAQYSLILYRVGMGKSPVSEKMIKERRDFFDGLRAKGELTVHGRMNGMGYTYAAISQKTDAKALLEALNEDAFVKRALETVEILPLYMTKDILKP
jgi:uncharacterized protein YciI